MECFTKKVNIYSLTVFARYSILDVWQGSEYTSEYAFWRGSKGDTQELLIYAKLIMVFILNLAFSPYSDSYMEV